MNRILHLGQISSTIDIPLETLRELNPQYKLDIIPATTKSYTLTLPQHSVADYIAHEQEIFAKDSAYLKEYINPANLDKKRQQRTGTVYVVKRGDTLGAIARRCPRARRRRAPPPPPLPRHHGPADALERHQECPQAAHRPAAPHRRKVNACSTTTIPSSLRPPRPAERLPSSA